MEASYSFFDKPRKSLDFDAIKWPFESKYTTAYAKHFRVQNLLEQDSQLIVDSGTLEVFLESNFHSYCFPQS